MSRSFDRLGASSDASGDAPPPLPPLTTSGDFGRHSRNASDAHISTPLQRLASKIGFGGGAQQLGNELEEDEFDDDMEGGGARAGAASGHGRFSMATAALELSFADAYERADAAVVAAATAAPERPQRLHETQRQQLKDLTHLHAVAIGRLTRERRRLTTQLEISHTAERQGLEDMATLMKRIRVLEAGSPKRRAGSEGWASSSAAAAPTASTSLSSSPRSFRQEVQIPGLAGGAISWLGERQQARNSEMEALHDELDAAATALRQAGPSRDHALIGNVKLLSAKVREARVDLPPPYAHTLIRFIDFSLSLSPCRLRFWSTSSTPRSTWSA